MKTALVITVRMKSSRLPKKALLEINGKSMLEHLIDRMKIAKLPDMIIVATSDHPDDAVLEEVAKKAGVGCFRGSQDDKLARYLGASKKFGFDYIVDVSADNPFSDAVYVDRIIEDFRKDSSLDFIMVKDMPLGTAPIGLKISAVEKICEIKTGSDTEAYGYYFMNSDLFKVKYLEADENIRRSDIRLTVDYQEDFDLVSRIFNELGAKDNTFSLCDVVDLFERKPELLKINEEAQKKYKANFANLVKAKVKPEFRKHYKESDLDDAA